MNQVFSMAVDTEIINICSPEAKDRSPDKDISYISERDKSRWPYLKGSWNS